MELIYDKRLKPCPICGAKAFVGENRVDGFWLGWTVGCPEYWLGDDIHGLDFDTPKDEIERKKLTETYYTTKEQAIEARNDRVEAGEWRISPWES